MDQSRMPDWARRNIEEHAAESPLETVRSFLGSSFSDADSIDQVRADLEQLARINIRGHQEDLRALEAVIADPPAEPNVLARLVAWDANWVLDDESDAGALAFLREIAQLLRTIIEEAPPTAERWRW